MQTRPIGSLQASCVGLGCNNFGLRIDEDRSVRVLSAALDAGINFYDTADAYGKGQCESILGRFFRGKRDQILIASKFGYDRDNPDVGRGSPKTVRESLEASLRRLQTDRIDLYQMHRPDPLVPVAETLGALAEARAKGLIREAGCSGFAPQQVRDARGASGAAGLSFVSVQNEYSMLHREPEPELVALCEEFDMSLLPFFPLADGLLTGKYSTGRPPPAGSRMASYGPAQRRRSLDDSTLQLLARLGAFATDRGRKLNELAIAWLAAQRTVGSVIAGATTPEQVVSNAAAADWSLTQDELSNLDGILDSQRQ